MLQLQKIVVFMYKTMLQIWKIKCSGKTMLQIWKIVVLMYKTMLQIWKIKCSGKNNVANMEDSGVHV